MEIYAEDTNGNNLLSDGNNPYVSINRIGDEDAEDFASTKHSGKPEKVAKETLRKLRDVIRTELESCGYTMTVKGDKLKSPGGTGPEDREHKVDEDVEE